MAIGGFRNARAQIAEQERQAAEAAARRRAARDQLFGGLLPIGGSLAGYGLGAAFGPEGPPAGEASAPNDATASQEVGTGAVQEAVAPVVDASPEDAERKVPLRPTPEQDLYKSLASQALGLIPVAGPFLSTGFNALSRLF